MNNNNIKENLIPLGPYSMATEAGNLLFISGQIPVFSNITTNAPNNIYDQTYQTLKNIQIILQSKNLQINDIIKTTLFIKNINDLHIINDSYRNFFESHLLTTTTTTATKNANKCETLIFPARSCIEVSNLPKNVSIEIEAIALIR